MARLTNRDYLMHRQFLIHEWEEGSAAFGVLPLQTQHDLHDYYAPSMSFTDHEALVHRDQMTATFPSLPQKAGRVLEAIRAYQEGRPNRIVDRRLESATGTIKIAGQPHRIRVLGIAQPKLDSHKISQLLARISREDVDGKLLAQAKKIGRRRSR
jgi:hypothetical protein